MERQRTARDSVTLFYDAGCGVCSWIALRVLRAASVGAVRVVPIDSSEADAQLGHLGERERWASWHLRDEHGRLFSGGAAAPVLLERLPHARLLAAVTRAAPAVTERLYRGGALTRSLWGRLVPRRSVVRARRELHLISQGIQIEGGTRCSTIP